MKTAPGNSVTEARIVEAAAQLFSRHGYKGTSTRDISNLAKVNEVTLFRYFPRKTELFWAAVDSRLSRVRMGRELQSSLAADAELSVIVPMLSKFLLEKVFEQPDLMRLLYVAGFEVPGADRMVREHLGPIFDVIHGYFERCAAKGQDQRCRSLNGNAEPGGNRQRSPESLPSFYREEVELESRTIGPGLCGLPPERSRPSRNDSRSAGSPNRTAKRSLTPTLMLKLVSKITLCTCGCSRYCAFRPCAQTSSSESASADSVSSARTPRSRRPTQKHCSSRNCNGRAAPSKPQRLLTPCWRRSYSPTRPFELAAIHILSNKERSLQIRRQTLSAAECRCEHRCSQHRTSMLRRTRSSDVTPSSDKRRLRDLIPARSRNRTHTRTYLRPRRFIRSFPMTQAV